MASLSMGLRPLGLVQGYYFAQVSSWSAYSGYPVRNYPCACYEVGMHQTGWLGRVDDLDRLWTGAHATALGRMLDEAAALGAAGVVGVTTDMSHPTNENSCEVHVYGTAVAVPGARPGGRPWSTQLAGQKLAKLVEIGFVPTSVAYARCTAMLVEGCNMEYYGSGRSGTGNVVQPLQDAHELARAGAIEAARALAAGASLYGVTMWLDEAERYGGSYLTCSLRGSLVRRARSVAPAAPPVATVNLGP